MDWTIDDLENFLEESDDFDALSTELIIDILGETEAQQFIEDFDLEFNNDDEIPWKEFSAMLNFEELCQDDNFIALIIAYFDCDEITIIDE